MSNTTTKQEIIEWERKIGGHPELLEIRSHSNGDYWTFKGDSGLFLWRVGNWKNTIPSIQLIKLKEIQQRAAEMKQLEELNRTYPGNQ